MNEEGATFNQARNRGLFNLPVGVRFSRLTDGRAVVYPWPWPLQVGCILPDEAVEFRVRATMRRWLRAALPVFLIFGLFGPRPFLSVAMLYIAAYYTRLLIATLGLPRIVERGGLAELHHSEGMAGR